LKDAYNGLSLFGVSALKAMKSILKYINLGYISNSPNISFYYLIETCSKSGLMVYQCWRGTNFTEDGVHQPICYTILRVLPWHTGNHLKDFTFKHNMITGTYNTRGQHYKGHYNFPLVNWHQKALNLDIIHKVVPVSKPLANWVNGDLNTQTTKVFGILLV
jgi:hypothetical protein